MSVGQYFFYVRHSGKRAFGQKGRRELADSNIRAKGKERTGRFGHSGGVQTHSGVRALGLK